MSATLSSASVLDLVGRIIVLASLRVLDEDGSLVTLSAALLPSDPRVLAFAKDGGLIVLAVDPATAPPLPAMFTLSLAEPGFRRTSVAVSFPANATFPLTLPDLTLRRVPITLRGRVVTAAAGAPLASASVTLAPVPAVAGQTMIALGQLLATDVPAGTPVVGFALTSVGGAVPIKNVQANAARGATELTLDDRQNLTTGQILRIGPLGRRSLARIAFVDPTPPLTGPGFVLLGPPLTATARQNDPAEPCTLGVAGLAGNSIGDAFAGEALVLADTAVSGDALLIGAAPYTIAPATDADGYYQRSGIARFRPLTVSVAAAGFASQTRAWSPGGVARLDFRLVP
jgi:hypothetical protein